MNGWIKLHRKMLDWEWYQDVNTKVVFLHLILTANSSDKQYRGQEIKRGELVTSYSQLAEQLGLSVKSVRTAIEHLSKGQTIGKRNGKPIGINGMIITICNYDAYNYNEADEGKPIGKPQEQKSANEGQTPKEKVPPIPPLKEKNKNLKERTTINGSQKERVAADAATNTLKRKNVFYDSLVPYVEKYGKDMIRDFFDYWSEMNRSQTKMRFEQQPTWEIGKRLATWASREKVNDKNKTGMNVGVILKERPKYTKGW